MTFHPQMQSHVHGVTVLGDLHWRAWPGLVADVWEVTCSQDARGEYVSQAPRLFVLLETAPTSAIDVMATRAGPKATLRPESPLCYVPAGMPLWSSLEAGGHLKHLDLHLDLAAFAARFPGTLDHAALQTPRLAFSDERLMALARLIARECSDPSDLHPLYSESLVTALLTMIGNVPRQPEAGRGRLAPRQLRRVTDYLEEHCTRNVSLRELADLVGLSPSHFAQAFKRSTGLPPHRWHLNSRVQRAQHLLETTRMSLTEAAAAAGFADQAHLTRVFRRFVGSTPAAWLRERRA